MYLKRIRPTVAANAKVLHFINFWFCLRFFTTVSVIYFARVTHSYALAVSILVITQITQSLLELPTGVISDRLGRVWCLRIGVLSSLLAMLCYAVGRYEWLVVGAILEGGWQALFSGNNEALLYETAREAGHQHEFHRYLAGVNAVMEVAGFAGAVSSGVLAGISFGLVLGLTAAAHVPALIATFWLAEPPKHFERNPNMWLHLKDALAYLRRNANLRRLSAIQVLGGGFSTFQLWPAFYSRFVPVWAVGMLISANYLESAIGFRASGWFMRRFRPINILLTCDIYSKSMVAIATILPSLASPALMALGSAPYGPSTVATGTLMHREFSDHQRATLASINAFLTSALFAIAGLMLGVIADKWGVGRAILAAQFCMLPTLWLYWKIRKTTAKWN